MAGVDSSKRSYLALYAVGSTAPGVDRPTVDPSINSRIDFTSGWRTAGAICEKREQCRRISLRQNGRPALQICLRPDVCECVRVQRAALNAIRGAFRDQPKYSDIRGETRFRSVCAKTQRKASDKRRKNRPATQWGNPYVRLAYLHRTYSLFLHYLCLFNLSVVIIKSSVLHQPSCCGAICIVVALFNCFSTINKYAPTHTHTAADARELLLDTL